MSTAVWSTEQVLALAPDAGSAKSGRDLATPRKWVRLGRAEGVIWGECQGSGAAPYQTEVELNEPAYHCSCPSRKFPCKHALGLFLIWAGQPGEIAFGDLPDWVASWLEGRAKRAEQKAVKEPSNRQDVEPAQATVETAARPKPKADRRAKVTAGLDELALWLRDLVRHGLAALPGQPLNVWDDRARRLIDAQAPGAARRVRLLADLSLTTEGWQPQLLERLARLHLLIEAHRRIDALPPEAQADLRAAIGYPIDLDKVRSGPGVRDVWQVIGQRTELDDRIRVRRTWLIGRHTARPALILDFAHVSQPMEAALPVGTAIDAELSFCSSATPLRALLLERHEPPTRLDALNGHSSIASAVAAHAETLALNPWLDAIPLVLERVVPVYRAGAWRVRDSREAVLPLSDRFEHGWNLLAVCGGRPLTLAGEFDGATLTPLSCLFDGRIRTIPFTEADARLADLPPLDGPPELIHLWQDITASALVGVGRKTLAIPASDDSLGQTLRGLAGREPAAQLLDAAAVVSLYARAGRKPPIDTSPLPEASPADDMPECSVESMLRLSRLLAGEHRELLPEWFDLLVAAQRRLRHDALLAALELGRKQSELRPLLRPALGVRGRWLAALNPGEWDYVGGDVDRADPEAVWQTGNKLERAEALRSLRGTDPDRARELVAKTWATESAEERAAIVRVFADHLSMADEPFLEAALDDRSKNVRKAAAELLPRLPDSRLARRMAERAGECVRWNGQALVVEPPKACDPAMVRDGVELKPPQGVGERAWWLQQVVAATPPAAWTAHSGPTPEQWALAAGATDWGVELWLGWAAAAARARDEPWVVALIDHVPDTEQYLEHPIHSLVRSLSPCRRDALILARIEADPDAFRPNSPARRMLRQVTTPVGMALAREVIYQFQARLALPDKDLRSDYEFEPLLRGLGRLVPPELADEAAERLSAFVGSEIAFGSAVVQFRETLRFRREMQQEFAR